MSLIVRNSLSSIISNQYFQFMLRSKNLPTGVITIHARFILLQYTRKLMLFKQDKEMV